MKQKEIEETYYKKALEAVRVPVCEVITALGSFMRLLDKKLAPDEKELLELTLKSTSYIRKTIDMLDDIFKIENKSFKLDYETFDFLSLIDEIILDLGIILKCESTNVEFERRETTFLKADRARVKTAVESLLLMALNNVKRDAVLKIDFKKVKERFSFELTFEAEGVDFEGMFEKDKKVRSCMFSSGVNFSMYLVKLVTAQHFGQLLMRQKGKKNTVGFVLPV